MAYLSFCKSGPRVFVRAWSLDIAGDYIKLQQAEANDNEQQ
jgi:hypothetical protein